MGRVIKARELSTRPRRLGAGVTDGDDARRWTKAVVEVISARDEEVLELAAVIAERVVGDAVLDNPAIVDGIYRRALATVEGLRPVSLRINPEDRATSGIDAVAAELGIEVSDDPRVGRFSCTIEACGVKVEHGLEPLLESLRLVARRGAAR